MLFQYSVLYPEIARFPIGFRINLSFFQYVSVDLRIVRFMIDELASSSLTYLQVC